MKIDSYKMNSDFKSRKLKIGLMGARVNNINLGCVALTYSLVSLLNRVQMEIGLEFEYIIFESKCDEKKYDKLSFYLKMPRNIINNRPFAILHDPLRGVKHFKEIVGMVTGIKECDIIIDLTEGDSFSDIYGDVAFRGTTNVKRIIENLGIPLILGPQTYGPFYKRRNEGLAKEVIKKAYGVIARDDVSANYVNELFGRKIESTIDLAFNLPYKKMKVNNGKIKIGINISSMLFFNNSEMEKQRFRLEANYAECIKRLIKELIKLDKYEIYLIPHVLLDARANGVIKRLYPQVITIDFIDNPIEMKSVISSMDLFIGSRMHATIAAVSSGVATIPLSYSRKFSGLYRKINYNHVIDLEVTSTEKALADILKKIDNRNVLINDIELIKDDCNSLCEKNYHLMKNLIIQICKSQSR